MDFNLTEDQVAFADSARAFSEQELAPSGGGMGHAADHSRKKSIAKAGELGFLRHLHTRKQPVVWGCPVSTPM